MSEPICPTCRRPSERTHAGQWPGRPAGWCDTCRTVWLLDRTPPPTPPPHDFARSSADRADLEDAR